ncbi:putative FtsX-related transmembrane transport protein [Fulvivirga imtechensis AK7]|uniref:Putative FtsX-related transmembrane transport protein n=1 Tax=Fulvivirga imtechensis AK7 TaxID=1237149 RepID=L8JLM9_9BACT|nr:ABC transporter permease [Fulvivirga imtechensis]ELR68419.1 putative FtsX-related transmembrane transport protein [Fulvivirga imtechensis AK7]
MLKNYIKIAFRNILRQKSYAFINIFGLAIGMAATILILLFVQDELSYDDYHEKSDRIYRVSRQWLNAEGESSLHLGHCAPPFGPLLQNDFEGIVEEAVRIGSAYGPLITYKEKKIEEDNFYLGDANIFEVFSWPLIEGDPKTALVEPAAVVITETTAQKYFGDEDPMDKMLSYSNFGREVELKVTGVAKDVPLNSHFKWDFMASFATLEQIVGLENLMQNWGSNNYGTYVLLEPNHTIDELKAGIPDFFDRHLGMGHSGQPASVSNKLHFMPVTDIHLHSHLDSEMEANSDIAYVYIYTIIAIFTLVIACINFMNLATARSAKRAKEVGLRKVMGAYRVTLIRQFITESVVFALLALMVASIIVFAILPYFNEFVGKGLTLNFIHNQFVIWLMLATGLFVGIVAGSYPAFFLSAFEPASILKGGHKSVKKFNLRSVLVVFQFFISIALIISVGVVHDQLEYVKNKDLGFNKENILVLPSSNQVYSQFASLKERFESQPGISAATLASRVPSGRLLDSQGASAEVDGEMKNITFRIADVHVDHEYLSSIEAEFVAGRDFDISRASDSTEAFILNEIAVEKIGWQSPEEAIGKPFQYGNRQGTIIGVVKDFHFESLHQSISPIVFLVTTGRASSVMIKYERAKKDEVVAYLKDQWSYLRPGFPFTYFEVDEQFNSQYESEDRLAKVITWFSGLAILIAALGLFGLASFIAEQRIKEIGVRKVLGASVLQILVLLTKGFTVLVFIALVLAAPLAYYGMNKWLTGFAYYGALQVWPFVAAGLFAIAIAWITVSYQTIKAARTNPVDSLRYE